jgi:sulfur-oxidizing protein SoxZ
MGQRTRRVVMPASVKAGEVVTIRAIIQHPMITGHSAEGANTRPRDIIHTMSVTYGGQEVFRADLLPGIAANPLVAFTLRADRTGDVVLTWTDDKGEQITETRTLTVT